MSSWVEGADGSGFGAEHLPYGVFSLAPVDSPPGGSPAGGSPAGGSASTGEPRCGVRIGRYVLDLARVPGLPHANAFDSPTLNAFLSRGRTAWTEARDAITALLTDQGHRDAVEPHLHPLDAVTLHLPVAVGDYVDFYSSEQHAANVGAIFRPDSPALPVNWKHLPIGYHGRAGTIVVSGTDVVRPCGQRKVPDAALPVYGPSVRLDIEAEVAFVVGTPSRQGEPVATEGFRDHVFGVALLNDWSARDIQAWEYVPLGPFLGKSFATSLATWVTPLDALETARVTPPAQDPAVLPYLVDPDPWALALELEVSVNGEVVSRPPFASMYWTPGQQLAHLTVNGASLRTGDLYASGTVTGADPDQRGSLLELTWNGTQPLVLPSGRELRFLEDGDEVTITATAPGPEGVPLTLAEVRGRILPALG